MNSLDLNGNRGFYSIRHGFETIAGDTGDQVADAAVMIRNGLTVDFNLLVDWEKLPEIRKDLDKLPRPSRRRTAVAEQVAPRIRAIAFMCDQHAKTGRIPTVKEILAVTPDISKSSLYRTGESAQQNMPFVPP